MSYTDTVTVLAERAERQLLALLARLQDGTLDDDEFVNLAVAILAGSRSQATALADAALATELTRLWGRYVAPLGLVADDDPDDLAGYVREAQESYQWRHAAEGAALGILARTETYDAAQSAYGEAMRAQGVVTWTRETNGGACPVCEDLANGVELSAETDMWTHKGCGCAQRPTN